jgi:LssY C-terminus
MSWRRQARRISLAAGLLVALCAWPNRAAALQPPASTEAFAGTWQAQFQGKTFLTIKLASQDGKLTGTVSHTNVQLDQNGDLTSAEPGTGEDSVVDTKLDGNTLLLTGKDQQSQATTQFQITLTGADQAEVQQLGKISGATPKPWKLERVAASSAAPAKPQDIKSKLAAAAQTWLGGQFGTGSPASSATTSSSSPSPGSGNAATSASAAPATELKVSDTALDASLRKDIDDLPRRVHDQFKNQGDMVNFVLIGSLEQVQAALQAADWHLADTDNKKAVLNAVLQTYDKKDYLAMPMSTLYLFDRGQDFGYEMADPYAVVASRHHFRLWKAPFTWNGQTVWAGAGTHDIGFEKDQRNGNVTHKIDPAVDGERENIGSSLQKSGKIKNLNYYLPPNPVQDARNATGGGYHSDGRILVIQLQ